MMSCNRANVQPCMFVGRHQRGLLVDGIWQPLYFGRVEAIKEN